MIFVPRPLLSALLLTLLYFVPLRAELSLLSGVSIAGGGEVVAHYNPASGCDRVLVTNSLARTTGVLALEVYRNGVRAADNDDWMQVVSPADLAAAGAFPLDGDTKSAAVRLSLTGGAAYTVEVFGAGAPGEVLLEVYQAP